MATGKAAFCGATTGIMHEAILMRAPSPPSTVNPRIPRELDGIVGKALEKDRDLRYQHTGDMQADLKRLKRDTESGRSAAVATPAPRSMLRPWLLGAVAVVLVAAVVAYLAWRPGLFRSSSPPVPPTHRQITFVGDATYPALSPDGKFVAYVTGKAGRDQRLMLQDIKGGQAIEISKGGYIRNPRWSPDGAELAVMRTPQQGIYLIPRLGGSSRFIAGGGYVCWSPDGSQIATAWQNEVGFRTADKLTGSAKSVHLSGFLWLYDLDWSASNLLTVLTHLDSGSYAIWTVRPDGGQRRKAIEENELASPRWDPAGDALYFLHTSPTHTQEVLKVAIDAKSGQASAPASVLLSGLQAGGYFTMSADGVRLAYSRTQNYSNLWLAQIGSPGQGKEAAKGPQTVSLTRGTSMLDSPRVSPDGKWVAFVTQRHIYKMAMDNGAQVQVTFSDATDASPAWSPDGMRIAFCSNEGGAYKVWIVGADGTNRRQLAKTELSTNGESIAWSPGSQILYQRQGNKNFSILDPETGEEQPLVRNEQGYLGYPRYSPDSRKVAVFWNRSQRGLWIISLVDRSVTLLNAGECRPAGWSPNGGLVYAYCGNDMLSVPAEGGVPRTIFTAPDDIASASVSADGKRFVYSVAEAKSDVWIVDNFDPAYTRK
jgi:Tol biopolymer transport system component